MKLLAWDTSSKAGALVAIEWDPALKVGWDGESARWKINDIDVFGVGVGPGSFTGLRIGVTTARTLAHTLKKPLVRVSSLAVLARPVALWLSQSTDPQLRKTNVVATTDACKGELFALVGPARSLLDCVMMAEGDSAGLWKRGVDEEVIAPEELMKKIKRKFAGTDVPQPWIAVGEGRHRYPDAWDLLPKKAEIKVPAVFSDQVQGRYLGLLAWEAMQAGLAVEGLSVHPRYLRASDAELKLKAGLLPPGPTRGKS